MAEPKQDPEMTAARAAKLVSRPAKAPDGKPIPIAADEVLAFRDCGDSVVVVTRDGQKFTGQKAAK